MDRPATWKWSGSVEVLTLPSKSVEDALKRLAERLVGRGECSIARKDSEAER